MVERLVICRPTRMGEDENVTTIRKPTIAGTRIRDGSKIARKVVSVLLAVTFGAAIVQAALTVYQNQSTPGLYAERFNVAEALEIDTPEFGVASDAVGALGVEGNEVEMTPAFPVARTALVQDNWKYTVTIKERAVSSITSGAYEARLYVNDALKGTVFLKAGSNTTAIEGATVTWNLGATVEDAPLFVVKLRPFVQSAPLMEFSIKSSSSGPTWVGVSAPVNHTSITGVTNPALNAAVGDMAKITWTNDDSGFHNLRIKNPSGTVVAGPTANINTAGQSAVLSYVLPSAGTYQYSCEYHPSMAGSLVAA